MYTDIIPDLQRLYYYVAVFEISLTFISGIVIVFMAVMLRKSFKQLSLRRTKDAYEPLIGELEALNGEYEYDRDIKIGVQSGIKIESTVENNMLHTVIDEYKDVNMMIIGDLNARSGELSDCLSTEDNVRELEEYNDMLRSPVEEKRISCDKTVNTQEG